MHYNSYKKYSPRSFSFSFIILQHWTTVDLNLALLKQTDRKGASAKTHSSHLEMCMKTACLREEFYGKHSNMCLVSKRLHNKTTDDFAVAQQGDVTEIVSFAQCALVSTGGRGCVVSLLWV